jgi:Putative MetA-pathway of phenol degradation
VLAGYHRRNLHWFYEADIGLPGIGYSSGNALNIGQHNYAAAPVAGFAYLFDCGKLEMSSRVHCIVTAGRETRSTRLEMSSCGNTP